MSSVAQIRGARGLIGWSQTDLAKASTLSLPTIQRFERGATKVSEDAIAKMRIALETAGVVFVEENGHGPGVRLRKSSTAGPDQPIEGATGDEEVDAARMELRDLQNRR